MPTVSSFRSIENKHDVYRRKACMKMFSEFLREHAMKIINFKKKKNEIVNKREEGIIWKCKNLLYFFFLNLKMNIWKTKLLQS